MPLFLSCENDFFPPSAGNSEGSGEEGGRLGGNFCHNFLPWLGLVSQARSTSAKKKGKDLVNCVYKPCPAALCSSVQSWCSILSHDALHHCLSSNNAPIIVMLHLPKVGQGGSDLGDFACWMFWGEGLGISPHIYAQCRSYLMQQMFNNMEDSKQITQTTGSLSWTYF